MTTTAANPTTLSALAIARAIFDIESALDLDDDVWVQGDVHWWPLYRLEIYRLLFAAQASIGAATTVLRWDRRLRNQLGPALKARSFDSNSTPSGSVWLVSDGLSWSRLGDVEVERFCTPIQQWCNGLGVVSTIIDRASTSVRLGQSADRWWTPSMQRRKIAAVLLARLRPNPQHAELVRLVVLAASRMGITLPTLSARRFDALARAVLLMARKIGDHMKAKQVRAVFLICFYDVAGYAVTLAAARAGVRSVDVQHGVTGPHHLAYTAWPVLHKFQPGWRLLPSHFWSWSAADAELINGWGCLSQPARLAICGGHPFLQAWSEGSMKLPEQMQKLLNDLLLSAKGRRRVLVTLQPGLTHADALEPLTQAWRLHPEMSWWLRLHPMALAEGPAIRALAQAHGLQSFDIDTATALPLPALLAQAHVHATHSSSTVIEAEAIGLSSVVWSKYGAELMEEQMITGAAVLALNGSSLVEALIRAQPPLHRTGDGPPGRPIVPGPADVQSDNRGTQGIAALRRLLEMNP